MTGRSRMAAFIGVLAIPLTAGAQSIAVGVKSGVSLTSRLDATDPPYRDASRRYAIGPMVEVSLPHRFSVEADVLFRREGFDRSAPTPVTFVRANRWEFPLLAKRRFGAICAGAGVAYERLTGVGPTVELRHRAALGVTAAVGFERRWHALRVSPEVRYVHWGERNFGTRGARLASRLDQVEILLGISFGN